MKFHENPSTVNHAVIQRHTERLSRSPLAIASGTAAMRQ